MTVDRTRGLTAPRASIIRARQQGLIAFARAYAGDHDGASEMLEDARSAFEDLSVTHPFAATTAYLLANRGGDLHSVHGLLVQAFSEPEINDDPRVFNVTLTMLIVTAHLQWDTGWWTDTLVLADGAGDSAPHAHKPDIRTSKADRGRLGTIDWDAGSPLAIDYPWELAALIISELESPVRANVPSIYSPLSSRSIA